MLGCQNLSLSLFCNLSTALGYSICHVRLREGCWDSFCRFHCRTKKGQRWFLKSEEDGEAAPEFNRRAQRVPQALTECYDGPSTGYWWTPDSRLATPASEVPDPSRIRKTTLLSPSPLQGDTFLGAIYMFIQSPVSPRSLGRLIQLIPSLLCHAGCLTWQR